MLTTSTRPITENWITESQTPAATAGTVNARLAQIDVADVPSALVPFLAAAAAELALVAGIPWRFSADDAPVAILRMIAKVAITRPDSAGPHTARLLEQLG